MKTQKQQLVVRINSVTKRKLKALAAKRGKTMTDLVLRAIDLVMK